jgi:chemotaxis protein CheD
MKSQEKRVRMAEYAIATSPGLLVTVGLGSCVGVALYDYRKKIGGLVHIMLPVNRKGLKPAKYADTGIELLIKKMIEKGANKRRLIAKIAGGSQMFAISGNNSSLQVGKRNIEKVRSILKDKNINIKGEDVGGDYGRTMKFHTNDGSILIKSHRSEDNVL